MNTPPVLILGIGNLLWADEGFGVRLVEELHRRYLFPPSVQLMDGGTQGMYLLPYIQVISHLLIVDAIDYGLPPGTIKVILNAEVPQFMGVKKMSLHQTGFQEVLAAAELTGKVPQHLALVGMQPAQLEDYGGSLTPIVKAQMEPALAQVLKVLHTWGISAEARTEPLAATETLSPGGLEIEKYELERPDEQMAYRYGDARVINQKK